MSKPTPTRDTMNYQLEGVSRELIERAREKAKACQPPLSVKHVLISLLTAWLNGNGKTLAAPVSPSVSPR